ncbi:hypothetical protein [Novipirellula artificiosorum]|uniref:THAP4-like heme-binding beta-barrel domain-containing protein n=1 Tax=Novipirellula artificiosorum TaxID=2528016 RepID=A0A5C6DGK7_9BACT|nr:hypothetical protein [Novipirellula artificiosorum]TWU34851.1 hypothetical protein Poly41_39940 [Novipirellula artificiosorum]
MRLIVAALTVVFLTCGVTYGQDEPGPGFEHLKCYGPFIGTWRYEGPLLEELPDIAKKGTPLVFEFSWRRILNKSAVEYSWSNELQGGVNLSSKGLVGWDAAQKQIISGGMNSVGGIIMGTVTHDEEAKSMTLKANGIDGEGEKTSFTGVVTKTGKDTLTWKALERTGGIVEGPSPVYTFKRVERAKKEAK